MIYEFFTGSYAEVGEDGISKFRLDTDAGTLTKVFAYQGIKNPSYIRFNADKSMLYAVQEETPFGAIHALRVDGDTLTPVGTMSTEGVDPCYISLTRDEKTLLVANYTGGSLAAYRLDEHGTLAERSEMIVHGGRGKHPTRQEAPHIHCAMEHKGQAWIVDLGLDTVFIYNINSGKLTRSAASLMCPPGSGPRHIALNPENDDIVYVIYELSNQVGVYWDEGDRYELAQMESTLPTHFEGEKYRGGDQNQGFHALCEQSRA